MWRYASSRRDRTSRSSTVAPWSMPSTSGTRRLSSGTNLVFGTQWHPTLLHLVLPLGISFFTFEFIHYLVDIHRGDVPVHSFTRFHVFAAFFPTQIAGPIKRFQQFVPSFASVAR